MRYYIIAGEASGDLHASNCMKRMLELDSAAEFRFTGGDLMQSVANVPPDVHIRDMAFMGFVDVAKNIGAIRRNFKKVKQSILAFRPHLVLLVDYPGFNLRMAEWATAHGFRVDYYISPTVWAWKAGRVEKIRKFTHRLFVILPFEKPFYAERKLDVTFAGHPLVDAIEQQRAGFRSREEFLRQNNLPDRPIIAVLPGSRAQEIERMLEPMMAVFDQLPGYTFVVAGAPTLGEKFYEKLRAKQVPVLFNQTYELMLHATAGIIKSGTSTLESALMRLPQVVCYKGGALSFAIGKRLVKVKYISLVNLILDEPVVRELVQDDMTTANIAAELRRLLFDEPYRAAMLASYDRLMDRLGGGGASGRVAGQVVADAREVS